MAKILIGFGVLVATGLFMALALVLGLQSAWVAERVWLWHVVPLAAWVPTISWRCFWAMGVVVGLVFRAAKPDVEEKKREASEQLARFVGLALAPWFCLLLAWVLR